MFFKDIIGQAKIKQRLIRSVKEKRISHAQLFSGAEGTGKFGLALAYAQFISCHNQTETDSCGVCSSCSKFSKLEHPDLHFVFPIYNKKPNQKAYSDDFLPKWREMTRESPYFNLRKWMTAIEADNAQAVIYSHESESIIRKLSLKPYEAEYKTMIIWLPEKMHPSCGNKLLKMIEEPPAKTLFLLITEEEEAILPTILSRTQIIRIPGIDDSSLLEVLKMSGENDPKILDGMIHRAGGSYLKALEYTRPDEDKLYYFGLFQQIMRFAWKSEVIELMSVAEELTELGRERQKDFFSYTLQLIREYFMMNLRQPSLIYLTKSEKEFGVRFAKFIHERNIILFRELFEEGYRHISMNGNARIIFTDTLLKIVRFIRR